MAEDIAPILAAEEKRRAAALANDADAMEALMTDDFVYVHSNGLVEGRDGYCGRIRTAASTYLTLTITDYRVRRHGSSATADGKVVFTYQPANGPVGTVKAHCLQSWIETKDGWKLVGYGSTPLP
jgi:ketosteroid isomerase-like protein